MCLACAESHKTGDHVPKKNKDKKKEEAVAAAAADEKKGDEKSAPAAASDEATEELMNIGSIFDDMDVESTTISTVSTWQGAGYTR